MPVYGPGDKIPGRDLTESIRRHMIETGQPDVDVVAAEQRWTTEELRRDFIVHGFAAPFVVVTRKSDGVLGTLEFTHSPRAYFSFRPD